MSMRWIRGAGRSVALLLVATVGATGCGTPTAKVSGTVTYKDKPVTSGEVLFVSEDGKTGCHASISPDGTYTMSTAPVGPVKAGVDNPPPWGYEPSTGKGASDPEAQALNPPKPRPSPQIPKDASNDPEWKEAKERAAHYVYTPIQYTNPQKSGLNYTVEKGTNTINIILK